MAPGSRRCAPARAVVRALGVNARAPAAFRPGTGGRDLARAPQGERETQLWCRLSPGAAVCTETWPWTCNSYMQGPLQSQLESQTPSLHLCNHITEPQASLGLPEWLLGASLRLPRDNRFIC